MKRGNRFANRILAALILTSHVERGVRLRQTTFVLLLVSPHPFFFSQVHYCLYLRALTSGRQNFTKKELLIHPFALWHLLIPTSSQWRSKLTTVTEYYEDSLGHGILRSALLHPFWLPIFILAMVGLIFRKAIQVTV